eukprot:11371007-Ditylum_brightwellii.AAC.1
MIRSKGHMGWEGAEHSKGKLCVRGSRCQQYSQSEQGHCGVRGSSTLSRALSSTSIGAGA